MNNSLAPFNYFTDVQDLSGKTEKKDNKNPELGGMGELDLRFLNEDGELCHIGEALILNSIRTEYTKEHLKKIFDYDANGLPVNFINIRKILCALYVHNAHVSSPYPQSIKYR